MSRLNEPLHDLGAPLVGIRVPDSEFIRQICIQTNQVPLALTSANVRYSNSILKI